MKRLFIALLVLGGLRMAFKKFRQFADPDPELYGHPHRPS